MSRFGNQVDGYSLPNDFVGWLGPDNGTQFIADFHRYCLSW
jgi:hypothetical protein